MDDIARDPKRPLASQLAELQQINLALGRRTGPIHAEPTSIKMLHSTKRSPHTRLEGPHCGMQRSWVDITLCHVPRVWTAQEEKERKEGKTYTGLFRIFRYQDRRIRSRQKKSHDLQHQAKG